MRPELELIEKIEQYLKGELTGADKAAFEKQMTVNPVLREEVQLQEEVMKGIERTVLKQKIQMVGKKFKLQINVKKWGWGLGVAAIVLVVFFYYNNKTGYPYTYEGNALPEYNELGERNWADPDKNIPAQTFLVNTSKDTVIETKAGIVMAVPAHTFLDEKGNAAEGDIELIVKEALDPATMLKAGLSTRSGNKLLESGGMFFTDARKDGKILKIDPARSIYAEIPNDMIKPGMQLFNGKRRADKTIDWINPKPLERELAPVDIQTLDFYPPHYLDSIQQWGYDSKNKEFTDSLYYSFAALFAEKTDSTAKALFAERPKETDSVNKLLESFYEMKILNRLPKQYPVDTLAYEMPCGINPSKIKAIWNAKFQNTILATREFEERLRWIHKSGDPAILDLYVNNLDKSLSFIDSLASLIYKSDVTNIFFSFAARHDGKVLNGSRQFEMLKDYYQKKSREFTEAVAKTQNEFWEKQIELDDQTSDRNLKYQLDSIERMARNFREELELNLKEAYRQLDKPWVTTSVYRAQVTTTGWCNVDRYVYESTIARTTLDYTDPDTGKKAVINYSPISIQVDQWKEYDRLYVYLLPGKLNSFMRLDGADGKFSEKLDELMKYDLVCIAYKDEQAYFYSLQAIQPKDYPGITLTSIEKEELDKKLNSLRNNNQSNDLLRETGYFRFDISDKKRQKHNLALQELNDKMKKAFFPCWYYIGPESQPIVNTPVK